MSWFLAGRVFGDEDIPKGAVGFVYIMQAVIDGKIVKYIGKKNFYSNRKRVLSKKKQSTDKRKKKYEIITKTDYHDYYSSNEVLKTAHKAGVSITRSIIDICYSKAELSYKEVKCQFHYNVLEREDFLNANILGKFFKKIP